jgi:hypothetical protein
MIKKTITAMAAIHNSLEVRFFIVEKGLSG